MKRLNRSLILGLIIGFLVLAGAIQLEISDKSAMVFLHPVGIVSVFGGLIASSLISVPFKELKRIFMRTFFVVRYPRNDFVGILRETLSISVGFNRDPQFLASAESKISNMMFREGVAFINMGYKTEEIRRFLEAKKEQNEQSLSECAVFYFGMAKMGPAFGLLGTLIGLIILLYFHMSSGDMDRVASSMGIGLTATLYGVGVSNIIFSPLGDYLQYNAEKGALQDGMIIEAVIQIKERRHPIYLLQSLKTQMPREDYKFVDEFLQKEFIGKGPDTGLKSGKAA